MPPRKAASVAAALLADSGLVCQCSVLPGVTCAFMHHRPAMLPWHGFPFQAAGAFTDAALCEQSTVSCSMVLHRSALPVGLVAILLVNIEWATQTARVSVLSVIFIAQGKGATAMSINALSENAFVFIHHFFGKAFAMVEPFMGQPTNLGQLQFTNAA